MLDFTYANYAWEQAAELLAIESPAGFTGKAAIWVRDAFAALGFEARITNKGGVLIDLGGENSEDALLLEAHTDTLGGMVSRVKDNGRLKLSPVGGLEPNNIETESVRVYTRRGDVYEGTIQLVNASMHVNGSYRSTQRTYDTIECVLDDFLLQLECQRNEQSTSGNACKAYKYVQN